ncbi:helix-turn-helix domain-containing protein [Sphingomonas montana]|uniref:helix-turn-helix domain-containing protein n=1 Tax=Sphingomonas montana TaxID=1843236 RepID=UPI00096E2EAD|nr:helix-turn-helix transcriptional regulator [Sphingomonas montana]
MPTPRRFAGQTLKTLRRSAALGQAAMAQRLGVSVSYLSQLENDDRPVTATVAAALARHFPLDWQEDDDAPARRRAALADAFADPVLAALGSTEGLARTAEQTPALADRFLALHAAWRAAEERRQIADEATASGLATTARLPWEEVRDWFHAAGNYVDLLDRAAERTADDLIGPSPSHPDESRDPLSLRPTVTPDHAARPFDTTSESETPTISAIIAHLADLEIQVRHSPHADAPMRRYDPAARTLTLNRALPHESRRFLLAHQIAAAAQADTIAAIVADADISPAARPLLAIGLANHAAGALLMPYARFARAARATRHDIDRLCQRFDVSFEQACHRLSTLQRPGQRGIPVFFCRVDMAGNITKRHSATRLQFARFGGACPLWIVHEAVAIPDRILVQLAETPDGVRYVSMAKGLVKPSGSFARAPRRYAVALGCEATQAAEFIYADGIGATPTPIGISCRLCPRPDCDQRAFPPADRAIAINPDVREVVPYRVL